MTAPHTRPHPPRRLPRVLPTPPRKPYMSARRRGLHRIVYDETLVMLLQSGIDGISATAKALRLARTVMERYETERKV
jgi:hypothetical protein